MFLKCPYSNIYQSFSYHKICYVCYFHLLSNFSIPGYYADSEAECQAFHICSADGQGGLTKYSFLCPNGTIFNQEYFICDWWFNVDCSKAEALATSRNAELEAARSEAEARIAAESNSLDTAASDASESVSNYGAPKTAEAPLANYASEDSNDAASSDLAPISNYGSQ